MTTIPVGIVGFRGYSGVELEHLLARHPHVRPFRLEHRQDAEHRPEPLGRDVPNSIPCTAAAAAQAGIKVVFLATPVEVSIELTVEFLAANIRVIDLSGAFRLGTSENFARWYKEPHSAPDLLKEAVYGLPEFYRSQIPAARLVSNPGCYPTAANLAIRPLIEAGIVNRVAGIVCDAKSGVSGAGRKPSLKTSFCEVSENFSVYSILNHRHVPEVLMNSNLEESEFSFTAHLLPVNRGILETIYIKTERVSSAAEILNIYQERYRGERFVRLYAPGSVPDLFSAVRTNFCDIGFQFDAPSRRLTIVAVIDNLVKGAAGQAIQNMNLMLGFDESEALL
ncbi:MAG TPA: N-acetyl-gamma-glutamyl-phosphate reductase [Bryobacteraceae bacterium]|jgi:N-acetyl-gamma-glutamyl-phosphate reductase